MNKGVGYHCLVCGYNGEANEIGFDCPKCGRVCSKCDRPIILVDKNTYKCGCRMWVE